MKHNQDSEPNRILDDRKTIIDRAEDRADDMESKRPGRDLFEKTLNVVPEGPFGKIGEGNVVGYAGYFASSTGQLAVLPIPGVRQPGYHPISHNVEVRDNFERHTVAIAAASKNVAEVAASYGVASPSNIDFITGEVDVVSTEKVNERSTYTTWEVVVDVADRGQKES
jgi:hypothetical protein